MLKKITSLAISIALLCSLASTAFAATEPPTTTEMDTLDVLVAAGSVLNSSKSEDALVDSATEFDKMIPLFNDSNETVAYYVKLNPSGYAVVNNNKENPAVIEFGGGSNKLIEEILTSSDNPHIIYINPLSVYDANAPQTLSIDSSVDFYDCYPDLEESNPALALENESFKQILLDQQIRTRDSNDDYGFIDWDDMPTGSYSGDTIQYASTTDWTRMDDYNSIADNHCGATALTNLALYFDRRGYDGLLVNNDTYDTFVEIHSRVGDGPELTIAPDAVEYFADYGQTLNYDTVSATFSNLKSAVGDDRICGMLLEDHIASWHWILGVGYRDYTNGSDYIRIHNGWEYEVDRFYRPGYGSAWHSLTEYWID